MTSFIEPLMQQSTPSIIADKLRQAIGHGELKPGAQLSEAELARKLGVSRGPLREGMQRLTQEGLLVSIRHRGLFVIEMTPDDVRDMYLAREAIERAAAHKILEGDYVAAGDVAARDRRADGCAVTTPAEVSELDIAFHVRLVELADSPRLTRMHRTFITETRMCIHALEESYFRLGGARRGAPRRGHRDQVRRPQTRRRTADRAHGRRHQPIERPWRHRRRRCLVHRDPNVFGLEELVDADCAALAAEAGLFDASERRGGVGHDALVESDHAGLEGLGDAECAA